jgi:hypothetical protein
MIGGYVQNYILLNITDNIIEITLYIDELIKYHTGHQHFPWCGNSI